jgi:hypothetical protein
MKGVGEAEKGGRSMQSFGGLGRPACVTRSVTETEK